MKQKFVAFRIIVVVVNIIYILIEQKLRFTFIINVVAGIMNLYFGANFAIVVYVVLRVECRIYSVDATSVVVVVVFQPTEAAAIALLVRCCVRYSQL